MTGFHIPGDHYYPNKGNGGWIEEDPEEDPKDISEEDPHEDPEEEEEDADDEGTESEPEVYNPPRVVPDL